MPFFFLLIKSPKAIMIDSIFLKILIELLKLLKGTVKEMQQKRSIYMNLRKIIFEQSPKRFVPLLLKRYFCSPLV